MTAHSILLDFITRTRVGEGIIKLLILHSLVTVEGRLSS